MTEINLISIEEATELFMAINGCSFVGLDISTKPILVGGKKNLHQGRVTKESTFTCYCGSNVSYEKTIQKKGMKVDSENFPNFKAERLWKGNGSHIGGAMVTNSNTKDNYLFYYVAINSVPSVNFKLDGKDIDKSLIEGLKPTQDTKTIMGLDGAEITVQIVVRTTKIENIKSFRVNGKNYLIKDNM